MSPDGWIPEKTRVIAEASYRREAHDTGVIWLRGRVNPMGYEVQTPVFEGPFDLLLHLILKEEVDLFEVSLSLIVDRYLVEVARLERVDLEVATEFLLIAATLVDLKARRLLPGNDDPDLDDELSRWDERDYL